MSTTPSPYVRFQDLRNFPLQHILGSHKFKHQEGWISGLTWHPNSRSFFTIHDRTRILQTSIQTGEPIGDIVEIPWWIDHLSVSPTGEYWSLVGMMGEVGLYHPASKKLSLLKRKSNGLGYQRRFCAFSPDGSFFVVTSADGPAVLVDISTKTPRDLPEDIRAPFAFSPRDPIFACTSRTGGITIYSTQSWRSLGASNAPIKENSTLRFSPSGEMLAAATVDQELFFFDKLGGAPLKHLLKDKLNLYGPPACIGFSPDEKFVYLASQYGTLISVSAEDQSCERLGQVWLDSQATCLEAFSRDQKWMLGRRGQAFYLFDLEKKTFADLHEGHTDLIRAISASPDGERAALADNDGFIRIWDTNTGECDWILEPTLRENRLSLSVCTHKTLDSERLYNRTL